MSYLGNETNHGPIIAQLTALETRYNHGIRRKNSLSLDTPEHLSEIFLPIIRLLIQKCAGISPLLPDPGGPDRVTGRDVTSNEGAAASAFMDSKILVLVKTRCPHILLT